MESDSDDAADADDGMYAVEASDLRHTVTVSDIFKFPGTGEILKLKEKCVDKDQCSQQIELTVPSQSCERVEKFAEVCYEQLSSFGENYAQGGHVGKIKISPSSHRTHRRLLRVVTTSSKEDEMQLRRAVTSGQIAEVKRLLDSGVDACCVDTKQRTALHFAAASGNVGMVKLLLDFGANPNQKDVIGNTPLHLAACSNNIPIVTALLQSGTDANTLDKSGRSPLQLASSRLRLLQHSDRYSSQQLKDEVLQIITMMQAYMRRVKGHHCGIDLETELNLLSEQLDKTATVEDIDSVNSLLTSLVNRMQI